MYRFGFCLLLYPHGLTFKGPNLNCTWTHPPYLLLYVVILTLASLCILSRLTFTYPCKIQAVLWALRIVLGELCFSSQTQIQPQ